MLPSTIAIEDVSDPVEENRHRESREHFARNSKWLQEHWNDVLPTARGRFIVVAGEEAFITDSAEAAWGWAAEQHSEDKGPLVQFVCHRKGHGFMLILGTWLKCERSWSSRRCWS